MSPVSSLKKGGPPTRRAPARSLMPQRATLTGDGALAKLTWAYRRTAMSLCPASRAMESAVLPSLNGKEQARVGFSNFQIADRWPNKYSLRSMKFFIRGLCHRGQCVGASPVHPQQMQAAIYFLSGLRVRKVFWSLAAGSNSCPYSPSRLPGILGATCPGKASCKASSSVKGEGRRQLAEGTSISGSHCGSTYLLRVVTYIYRLFFAEREGKANKQKSRHVKHKVLLRRGELEMLPPFQRMTGKVPGTSAACSLLGTRWPPCKPTTSPPVLGASKCLL